MNNILITKNSFVNIFENDKIGIGTNINQDVVGPENNVKLMLKLIRLPMRPPSLIVIDDQTQANQVTSTCGSPKIDCQKTIIVSSSRNNRNNTNQDSNRNPWQEDIANLPIKKEIKTELIDVKPIQQLNSIKEEEPSTTSTLINENEIKKETITVVDLCEDEVEIKKERIVAMVDLCDDEVEVKKENIVGMIDLCLDEDEIVISEDENWIDSQQYANNIKRELLDLDYVDDDIICVEEQEVLERWRKRIFKPKIKAELVDCIEDQDYDYDEQYVEQPTSNKNNQVKILSVVSLNVPYNEGLPHNNNLDLHNYNVDHYNQGNQAAEYYPVMSPVNNQINTTVYNYTDIEENVLNNDDTLKPPSLNEFILPKVSQVSSIRGDDMQIEESSMKRKHKNESIKHEIIKKLKTQMIAKDTKDIKDKPKSTRRHRSKSLYISKHEEPNLSDKKNELKKTVEEKPIIKESGNNLFQGKTNVAETQLSQDNLL